MTQLYYHVLPSVEELDIEAKKAVTRRPAPGEEPMHFSVYLHADDGTDTWVADTKNEKVANLLADNLNAIGKFLHPSE